MTWAVFLVFYILPAEDLLIGLTVNMLLKQFEVTPSPMTLFTDDPWSSASTAELRHDRRSEIGSCRRPQEPL